MGGLFIHGCGTTEKRNQQDHINQSFTLEEIQGLVELEGRRAEGSGSWFSLLGDPKIGATSPIS